MASAIPDEVLLAFSDFDTNGNGTIEANELKAVFQRLDPKTFNDDVVAALFSAADADSDGKVHVRDFMTWIFTSSEARAAREALDQERMQKASLALLSVDLSWMKQPVDQTAFNAAVLKFIKQSGSCPPLDDERDADRSSESSAATFDVGGGAFDCIDVQNALATAHALLSINEHAVPPEVFLEPQETTVNGEAVEVPLTDDAAAPLLYAALAAGCRGIFVRSAPFGEKMTAALEVGLPDSRASCLNFSNGYISDERDVVRIADALTEKSMLETIDLSNNVVGIDGLRAVHAALLRCPKLRNVYLYNIGPWTDGDGLGCRRDAEDEDVMLLKGLRKTIKERKGVMQNEAFHEGDVEMSDDDGSSHLPADAGKLRKPVAGRAAFVHNNSIKGGRIMLRSRPVAGSRFASGWICDGQSVLVLRENPDGQWVEVQTPMPSPLKGWLKSQNLRSA